MRNPAEIGWRFRFGRAVGTAAVLGGTGPVLAQTSAPVVKTTSLWSVMWQGMDWPALLIIAGSVTIIALIVEHFITIRRATIAPLDQVRKAKDLIERRDFSGCLLTMKKSSTFFASVLTAALDHARHGFDAMHEAALEKSSELSGQMFRKVEYMNILGNLGPLMGLLGTVLGMIISFAGLGSAGGEAGADAGALARGISLALVNTLLGLALAIIGIGFYGFCRNRVDGLTVFATVRVLDLLEYFRPAASTATPQRMPTPSAPPPSLPPRPVGPAAK